jgi:hypothetical protein
MPDSPAVRREPVLVVDDTPDTPETPVSNFDPKRHVIVLETLRVDA